MLWALPSKNCGALPRTTPYREVMRCWPSSRSFTTPAASAPSPRVRSGLRLRGPHQEPANRMAAVERVEQTAHLVAVPDVAALELGQRHVPTVDVVENRGDLHINLVLPVRSSCIMPCLRSRVLSSRASSADSSASMSDRTATMAVPRRRAAASQYSRCAPDWSRTLSMGSFRLQRHRVHGFTGSPHEKASTVDGKGLVSATGVPITMSLSRNDLLLFMVVTCLVPGTGLSSPAGGGDDRPS